MKRGAGNHHRTSGGRWLKVPWCLLPRPRCALPETPRGEANVLVPAPQQRATTLGEPRQNSSRVRSRLSKDTLVPAAPICSALAAADSSERRPQPILVKKALWRRTGCEARNNCPSQSTAQVMSVAAHQLLVPCWTALAPCASQHALWRKLRKSSEGGPDGEQGAGKGKLPLDTMKRRV